MRRAFQKENSGDIAHDSRIDHYSRAMGRSMYSSRTVVLRSDMLVYVLSSKLLKLISHWTKLANECPKARLSSIGWWTQNHNGKKRNPEYAFRDLVKLES